MVHAKPHRTSPCSRPAIAWFSSIFLAVRLKARARAAEVRRSASGLNGRNKMRNLIGCIVLVLLASHLVHAQKSTASEIPTIAYCDLLRHPELYEGKVVRIGAIYRYGFEWSEFYCFSCLNQGQTWVDFDESYSSRTKSKIKRKLSGNGEIGRTISVVAVGRFYGSGGYGHMGAYRYKFLVSYVEQAKVILNESPSPTAMPNKSFERDASTACLSSLPSPN